MSSTEDTNRDARRLDALARARLIYILLQLGKQRRLKALE